MTNGNILIQLGIMIVEMCVWIGFGWLKICYNAKLS
jgi:hypothetical protein